MFIAIADFYRRSVQSCPEWKRTLLVTPLFYFFSTRTIFFSRRLQNSVTHTNKEWRKKFLSVVNFIYNISFLINLTKLVDNLTFHRLDNFGVLLHITNWYQYPPTFWMIGWQSVFYGKYSSDLYYIQIVHSNYTTFGNIHYFTKSLYKLRRFFSLVTQMVNRCQQRPRIRTH